MKFISPLLFFLISGFALAQTQKASNTKTQTPLDTKAQRTSYGFGVLVAQNLKAQTGDSLDLEAFYRGIRDAYQGQALQIKKEECEGLVQAHVQSFNKRKLERIKRGSLDFLEKNKLNADVKTTVSGLQYKVISTGTGVSPTTSNRVTVHYTGKLIDGTIFDSSVQRGQPATFAVTGVIRGWTEALQLMHEGDKWILYIPQELGYGANGNGQIPPYAALIFELELIKVN
jgi:FKBP-type peptidyl-prolyl cis-trans isomerase